MLEPSALPGDGNGNSKQILNNINLTLKMSVNGRMAGKPLWLKS